MKIFNPDVHARQKERIFKTALHLFATQGFVETSMAQIAKACHLQKTTLYHYFKSKEEILKALVEWRWKQIKTRIQSIPEDKSLKEILELIAKNFMKDLRDKTHQEFMLLMYRQGFANPGTRKIFISAFQNKFKQHSKNSPPQCFKNLKNVSQRDIERGMHQFIGALMRYATETKLWKAGQGTLYSEKEYISGLVKIFSQGLH